MREVSVTAKIKLRDARRQLVETIIEPLALAVLNIEQLLIEIAARRELPIKTWVIPV